MSDKIDRIKIDHDLDQQTEPTQDTLLGEWGRMQHTLIDKATAAQIRLQALYKKVMKP